MELKHIKPGFYAFIKTRLRYPLKSNIELLFTDNAGVRYTDMGSAHTTALTALYLLLFIVVIFQVNFTVLGWVTWLLLPLLHRFIFRYFWTIFEVYEYEFAPVKAEILLRRRESRKSATAFKKAAAALETMLVVAAVVVAFIGTGYPPFTAGTYDGVPLITAKFETPNQIYEYARDYVNEQCPGSQLVAYKLIIKESESVKGSNEDNYILCYMIFKSPDRGLFIQNPKEIIWADIFSRSEYMHITFHSAAERFAGAKEIEFVPIPGDYPEGFYK